MSCGCCIDALSFNDENSLFDALDKVGLTTSGTITDDAGIVHKHIDTFYGFSQDEKNQEERSLSFLMNMLK
jgi:hypothetical protein